MVSEEEGPARAGVFLFCAQISESRSLWRAIGGRMMAECRSSRAQCDSLLPVCDCESATNDCFGSELKP